MPAPDMDRRLASLWEHPVMDDTFLDPERRNLGVVLDELCRYGQPVLAAHDVETDGGVISQEWVCSMNWRTREEELISAGDSTKLLAALYCLLEVKYYVRRQVRDSIGGDFTFGQ